MVRTVDTERVAARDACASFLMRHVLFRHLAGRNPVLSRSAPLPLALQWTYLRCTRNLQPDCLRRVFPDARQGSGEAHYADARALLKGVGPSKGED